MSPTSPDFHLLLDENIEKRFRQALQSAGYQATHINETTLKGQKDSTVLRYAQDHAMTIIT